MILPADKGKAAVIMDKEDYDNKVNTMLSDTNTYKKLTRDPTQAKKRILIQKLTKLEKEGKNTKQQYKNLYPKTKHREYIVHQRSTRKITH